mgnify:FL=1
MTGTPNEAVRDSTRSLAALISRLGADVTHWDRSFARQLATALAAECETLTLAPVERLDLRDVVVTFSLAERLSVVVTGRLPDVPGELTLRWREADLIDVGAELRPRKSGTPPYLVCSLDFGPAGQHGVLLTSAEGLPAGQVVRIRARATVGQREEWRVQALGLSASVALADLRLLVQE